MIIIIKFLKYINYKNKIQYNYTYFMNMINLFNKYMKIL